jgi:hypothetical protein
MKPAFRNNDKPPHFFLLYIFILFFQFQANAQIISAENEEDTHAILLVFSNRPSYEFDQLEVTLKMNGIKTTYANTESLSPETKKQEDKQKEYEDMITKLSYENPEIPIYVLGDGEQVKNALAITSKFLYDVHGVILQSPELKLDKQEENLLNEIFKPLLLITKANDHELVMQSGDAIFSAWLLPDKLSVCIEEDEPQELFVWNWLEEQIYYFYHEDPCGEMD